MLSAITRAGHGLIDGASRVSSGVDQVVGDPVGRDFLRFITRQAIRRGTFTSVKDLTAGDRNLHRQLERAM